MNPPGRSLPEKLTEAFYNWEVRGRGWRIYPYHVSLEPPFSPFRRLTERVIPVDDGQRPQSKIVSSLIERLYGRVEAPPPAPSPQIEEEEPSPFYEDEGELVEVRAFPSEDLSVTSALSCGWLNGLSRLCAPASFDLVGSGGKVQVLLACRSEDASMLSSQARGFFPDVRLEPGDDLLLNLWEGGRDGLYSVLEFGLAREFMAPLLRVKSFSPDPLTSLVAALAEAGQGEVVILQVLFQGVRSPWRESVLRSVVTPTGEPFFLDAPDITKLAYEKVAEPLFAVAVRVALRAPTRERLWNLLRGVASAVSSATRGENELVPLGDSDLADPLGDVLLRTTHRSGMLLSLPELASLVHFPSGSLQGILREGARTKHLPSESRREGVLLGVNLHQGEEHDARLSTDVRMRHVHVVGASGTGKSTLLIGMILQDIMRDEGVGVLDPHGDLIDEVLARIPKERAGDVILFDPADPEYAVGWNMLSASSETEKDMLSSDLVSVFRRLSTSWGDQMTAVLSNAVLAFLESRRGGTLLDLRRFLVDSSFREEFLRTVSDTYVRDFWLQDYPLLGGRSTGPILTRLDALLRPRLVRGVVTLRERSLDFRDIVDRGRIFLGRLSQGAIGEENAALLGSLLVSKFHQVSLLRQDRREEERRPFFLFVDEFHNLATPSMASLFSGARKYRLSLTVAHQDLYQLRASVPEVERSVLANAHSRIMFRLGEEDARTISGGLSFFTAEDLGNLGTGEAIVRIGRRENDFNLQTAELPSLNPLEREHKRSALRSLSLRCWGSLRSAPQEETTRVPSEEGRGKPLVREDESLRPTEQTPVPSAEIERLPDSPSKKEEGEARAGKGGAEHTYLQELVKRWSEERGFRAAIEEQIAGNKERIDIALYRGSQRIACEITVSTPLEYEVGNVEKCLDAGFPLVALISLKKGRLQKIEKLLAHLSPERRERVHLFTPEEFLAWLSGQPVDEEEKLVGGYRVKTRYKGTEDPRAGRVAEILARSMARLRKDEE